MTIVFWFALYALAIWRLASMLVDEPGPGRIFAHIRAIFRAGEERPVPIIGGILECLWCCSVWVAIPFAYLFTQQAVATLTTPPPFWVLWFVVDMALSASAIWINRQM